MGKGSRQNRSITLGKGLTLRVGYMGSCLDVCAEPKLLDASGGEWILAWRGFVFWDVPCAANNDLRTGADKEWECLIKTKHCDGFRTCWLLPSVLNVKVMQFNREEVNGGSSYDPLQVATCVVI